MPRRRLLCESHAHNEVRKDVRSRAVLPVFAAIFSVLGVFLWAPVVFPQVEWRRPHRSVQSRACLKDARNIKCQSQVACQSGSLIRSLVADLSADVCDLRFCAVWGRFKICRQLRWHDFCVSYVFGCDVWDEISHVCKAFVSVSLP
ncbi:hypothetical protein L596_020368 [Steinernema carpocapsae]|uniref:Transmembrane protein n=1 Tax=Steinernema carpocapsae TaxID=34508 RepID=A0A4U5MTB3_STECR|nr:hypothetical protein L596_020368 [Steinernema carpocapsae]